MIWFLSALAVASPTEPYPWQASVELPAEGVSRITVPAALRSAEDPIDGRDLLLLDADGQSVPFAVLRGGAASTTHRFVRGTPRSPGPLITWPDEAEHSHWVRVGERPVDALRVVLPPAPSAARVTVHELIDGDLSEVSTGLVWRIDSGEALTVALPPRLGTFLVELDPQLHLDEEPRFEAIRTEGIDLPDETLRIPVTTSRLQENGWTRYDLELPSRLPLTWLEADPVEDLFSRDAAVVAPRPWSYPGSLPPALSPNESSTIERLQLDEVRLDRTRLAVPPATDHGVDLSLLIHSESGPPLQIPDVVVGLPGQELLVRDAGPGPHTLFAGRHGHSPRSSDLQFAAAELSRVATGPYQPGDRVPNPSHRPPEELGDLGSPGVGLERDRSTFVRAISGEPGLVRIPVDLHVLTHARADLGDLRLVTADGRQIAYVLSAVGTVPGWTELPFERTEQGGTSVLEVTLPEPNLLVGGVTLHTEAPLFRRGVRLSQPRGGVLSLMRSYTWVGSEAPGALSLDVHRRVGDTLVVEVDNGDDAPLPLHQVDVDWSSWELVAVLPEEPVELRYGDLAREAPAYDLRLVRDLVVRAEATASLGEVEEVGPRPVAFLDRALVFGGVGVLGVGLLVLTVLLIRGAPAGQEDADAEAVTAGEDPPSGA